MPSPTCTVNGSAPPQDVGAAANVTIALVSAVGVGTWLLTCIGADDTTTVESINATLTVNQTTNTATFTAAGVGTSYVFQSTVGVGSQTRQGAGYDAQNVFQRLYTTTFKVTVLTTGSLRVISTAEAFEQDPTYGTLEEINAVIRAVGSGSSGPQPYGVDSNTFHRWIMNDPAVASGSVAFADTGTAADAALTVNYVLGTSLGTGFQQVGLYSDCYSNDGQGGSSGGYSLSSNDVGIPATTTTLSLSLWVRPRSFTAAYARLIGKAYNPGITTPYISLGLGLVNETGQPFLEWTQASTYTSQALGQSGAIGKGYLKLDQWQHIAATISIAGGNASVIYYWNGDLIPVYENLDGINTVSSGPIQWNSGSSGPWIVGGAASTSGIGAACFDGWIFDARVDVAVRSASYWKALYQAGAFVHS
jgi:concanavalin A-like lectin/glucanase superfamily protein